MYRLVPLLRPSGVPSEAQGDFLGLKALEAYYLDAEEHGLSDYVFMSVPPSMPIESLKNLQEKCTRLFEKPVVLVTHNIAFLKAVLISERDAKRMIENDRQAAIARAKERAEREGAKATSDSGGGSRPGQDGDCGVDMESRDADGFVRGTDLDEKGDEKGVTADPSVNG